VLFFTCLALSAKLASISTPEWRMFIVVVYVSPGDPAVYVGPFAGRGAAESYLESIRKYDYVGRQVVALGSTNLKPDGTMFDPPEPAPPPPPVDRTQRVTLGGTPIGEHLERKENGQQKDYIVLTEEERKKGFVRPVRRTYVHLTCKTSTTMGAALAETYARDPKFYSGTFCCACADHFPVGEDGEFVWSGTKEKVGT
jgi:hypothetical protein